MTVLRDVEIVAELNGANPIAKGFRTELLQTPISPVKGASLDLTVGSIFIPGTSRDVPGGLGVPLEELALMQGHTAVIETQETINLSKRMAAIAFPPASVSMAGLLTTNPGHVDPGYEGPLHLTVINMGRLPFSLKRGDRIIRLIIFELSGDVSAPAPKKPAITPTLLDRLSQDFLNIDERAAAAAKEEVAKANIAKDIRTAKTTFYVGMAAAFAALFGGAITLYNTSNTRDVELRKEISEMRSQIARVEAKASVEDTIRKISDRLLNVENSIKNVAIPADSTGKPLLPNQKP
ncbi:dCTP deaminase [Bradyrhizobium sp. LB12.1]|uniref:dCTP deaminase n=1 Tax=Bradyrhizobium sp. LB12.1 TaxID=3156327 RepID=UPI00339157C7